jgi:hypothetical protein
MASKTSGKTSSFTRIEEQLELPFEERSDFIPWIMCAACGKTHQKGDSSWALFGVCEKCYRAEA